MPQWKSARIVAFFAAHTAEPDLEELWSAAAGKTICYPRVNGVEIDLIAVPSPSALETSRWQLREPMHDETKIITPAQLDLIFIPGLAFSRTGARLGRGGGFYDRLLVRCPSAFKVGICFEAQIFDDIPRDPHDQRADIVTTESG